MDRNVSCCGVMCAECEYYPKECAGCAEIRGKVFWLQYTGESICDIYECCVEKKRLAHCGQCGELPCARYDREDPTKSHQQNEDEMARQLERLRGMWKEEE